MSLTRDDVWALWHWQYRRTDCFSDKLFDLIQKADPRNLARLELGFPTEVEVWRAWREAGNFGEDLFTLWLNRPPVLKVVPTGPVAFKCPGEP